MAFLAERLSVINIEAKFGEQSEGLDMVSVERHLFGLTSDTRVVVSLKDSNAPRDVFKSLALPAVLSLCATFPVVMLLSSLIEARLSLKSGDMMHQIACPTAITALVVVILGLCLEMYAAALANKLGSMPLQRAALNCVEVGWHPPFPTLGHLATGLVRCLLAHMGRPILLYDLFPNGHSAPVITLTRHSQTSLLVSGDSSIVSGVNIT